VYVRELRSFLVSILSARHPLTHTTHISHTRPLEKSPCLSPIRALNSADPGDFGGITVEVCVVPTRRSILRAHTHHPYTHTTLYVISYCSKPTRSSGIVSMNWIDTHTHTAHMHTHTYTHTHTHTHIQPEVLALFQ
jgi:hypothetical protein